MSHPNSPRVSTDSAASQALSHAGDEQAPKSGADTAADTSDNATSPAEAPAGGVSQLLTQAQQWLQDSGLKTSLSQVPEPVKRLASRAGDQWKQLTTTQKVVGGALLAAGSFYLLRGASSKGKGAPKHGGSNAGTQAATLHELLLFVNDRVEGYQRAAAESKDTELQSYYQQLVSQSKDFARKLNSYLREQGGGIETSTTLKGKLYRAWMDAKAAVTGFDEKAILGSNVYGEEWAIKAYKEALADQSLTWSLRSEVQRQYAQSQKTYARLQELQKQQQ